MIISTFQQGWKSVVLVRAKSMLVVFCMQAYQSDGSGLESSKIACCRVALLTPATIELRPIRDRKNRASFYLQSRHPGSCAIQRFRHQVDWPGSPPPPPSRTYVWTLGSCSWQEILSFVLSEQHHSRHRAASLITCFGLMPNRTQRRRPEASTRTEFSMSPNMGV